MARTYRRTNGDGAERARRIAVKGRETRREARETRRELELARGRR